MTLAAAAAVHPPRHPSLRRTNTLHSQLLLLLLPLLLPSIVASHLTVVQIEPFTPPRSLHSFLSSSSYSSGGGDSYVRHSHNHDSHRHNHSSHHLVHSHHRGGTRHIRSTTPTVSTVTFAPIGTPQPTVDSSFPATSSITKIVLALLLLPFLCATGLVGNALVCVAIATDRRLQNVTNYFLFSLAVADLLVCCVVMPLSILVEIKNGQWEWNFYLCLLYVYADVFLCSASIVHMSVISLDRYLGISQPLKTRNRTKTAIFIKIILVWVITILISSPIVVLGLVDHKNVLEDKTCQVHNRSYMIYGSTFAFLIPFIIMTVTYFKTTSLLNKQALLLQQGSENGTKNGLRRAAPPRKLGYSRRRSSGGNSTPTMSAVNHSKWSSSTTTGVSLHNINATAASAATVQTPVRGKRSLPPSIWQRAHTLPSQGEDALSDDLDVRPTRDIPTRIQRWTTRTSSYVSLIVSRMQRKSSYATSMELLSEHKATRVLAVVFICFFFCWTPFFIANFLYGFFGGGMAAPLWANVLFLWMGYVSSTINPLIYTVFNKRFRTAFIRILRCKCVSKRSAENTYVGANSYWSRTHTIMPDACTYSNYEQRSHRADESMVRPPNGTHKSSLSQPQSNGMSPLTNGNGIVQLPRKKDSQANGRSVMFDNRQWSTTSSTTSTTIRKESSTAGSRSRTPSVRKTSRYAQCTARTNTEDDAVCDEEDADSALGTGPHSTTNTDRDGGEHRPLVYRMMSPFSSRTPSSEEDIEEKDEEEDEREGIGQSPSTHPIPSGAVRVTVSQVEPQRSKNGHPFILLASPSMKRSLTNNAILESPTRLIPTANDMLVAHPLTLRGSPNCHVARGALCASSEHNLSSSRPGPSSSPDDETSSSSTISSVQTSIGGCTSSSPPRSSVHLPPTVPSVPSHSTTPSSSSSSSPPRDNGPALTLIGTNGRGSVFKETFL